MRDIFSHWNTGDTIAFAAIFLTPFVIAGLLFAELIIYWG